MQERRTTIRVNRLCRAQYCPSEDLLPRDGRLTNLSERGAGLLARETHRSGEQVTVGVLLPGEQDTLTATGVVRWAAEHPRRGRWYPLGLEWLPLEDTTRHRLYQFLYRHTQSPSAAVTIRFSPASGQTRTVRRDLMRAGVVPAAVMVCLAGVWAASLHRRNRQLQAAIEQRTQIISRLKDQGTRIKQELGVARVHLAATSADVTRLDQQAQRLQGETTKLTEDVEHFQSSYTQLREEREALLRRLLDFKQERELLTRQSVSIPDLHLAIREAIQAREAAWRSSPPPPPMAATPAPPTRTRLSEGNRGYVVKDGRPTTLRSSPVWIRVHDPQSLLDSRD